MCGQTAREMVHSLEASPLCSTLWRERFSPSPRVPPRGSPFSTSHPSVQPPRSILCGGRGAKAVCFSGTFFADCLPFWRFDVFRRHGRSKSRRCNLGNIVHCGNFCSVSRRNLFAKELPWLMVRSRSMMAWKTCLWSRRWPSFGNFGRRPRMRSSFAGRDRVLDILHAAEHAAEASKRFFDKKPAKLEQWYAQARDALLKGEGPEWFELLRTTKKRACPATAGTSTANRLSSTLAGERTRSTNLAVWLRANRSAAAKWRASSPPPKADHRPLAHSPR